MIISQDIMDEVYIQIDLIKESEEYIELKKSYLNLIKNDETKSLIKDFDYLKNLKYKTKDDLSNLSNIKSKLYRHSLYKEYIRRLNIFNNEVERIENIINNTLFSEEVKKIIREVECDKKNRTTSLF